MNPYDAPDVDRIDHLAKRIDDLERRVDALVSVCATLGFAVIALAIVTLIAFNID